jgi:hypothetical protein
MQVASALNDTIVAITKQLKANDIPLRVTVLEALKDIVEGISGVVICAHSLGVGSSGGFVHAEIAKAIKPCFTVNFLAGKNSYL